MLSWSNGDTVADLGWRQGAFLGSGLASEAWSVAPAVVEVNADDRLIVTSHDCDVVNPSLEKEPVVEVLRARVVDAPSARPGPYSSGRNPRELQLNYAEETRRIVLRCTAHERWPVSRRILTKEPPCGHLPPQERRLVSGWLAKRYIRGAFPTEFDRRWRSKSRQWRSLLESYSEWIQGVYLRLNTHGELPTGRPYACGVLLAVPQDHRRRTDWPATRDDLESRLFAFWEQFKPHIRCADSDVLGTDEITLAQLSSYQRFDADWVSFEDDTATTPNVIDLMP